ncbi:MAG: right-handed parallel beta-helix repeat-containing protein [Flavobacteriales bacterium]|nr:MAG: right-handed parallel beta-helix repeat-containing protein [Flavobacteriales bacterium]
MTNWRAPGDPGAPDCPLGSPTRLWRSKNDPNTGELPPLYNGLGCNPNPAPRFEEVLGLPEPGFGERPVITGLDVDPNDPKHIVLTFSGYEDNFKIFESLDGGDQWSNLDPQNSLPNLPVNDVAFQHGTDGGVYIAMDAGVFFKDIYNDIGGPWDAFYADLPNARVTELDINYCVGKIRASTYGRGLWESDLAMSNSKELVVDASATWGEHMNLATNLRVTNGAVLTVTNTVNFAPGTRLTIEPGSKVVVNGGKLLNMCGKSWHGVDVVGDPALSQVPSTNQGRLDLINGALIRNAEVGARAYRTDASGNYIPGTEGGIIRSVNGSQFIDCGRMVALKPYENVVNGNEISNRSYFSSTTFLVTPERPTDLTYNIMVMLEDVSGVQFNNCTFQCEENLDHGVPGPTAIRAFDTRFTVTSSDFVHVASGIRASDASGINPCYIRGNTFSETDRGIALMGVNFAEVTGNTFNVTDGPGVWPFTDPLYPTPYGLYLFGCEGFEVEENSFSGVNPEGNVGIATRNIDIGANQFYRNTFDGVLVGSLLQRDNRDENILNGLQFLCNTYGGNAECEFDIAVTDQGEVAPFQGDIFQGQPAGNQFYPECTAADESDIYVENDAPSGFTYIHHVDDFCEPACSTPTFVTLFEVNSFFISGDDETSTCPSDRSIEHDPVAQAQKFALIKQQYIALKALYDGEVNAGNTQYLLDLISHSSTTSFDLRTQLLAASPALSDDVMIAAIEREPAMNDLHISQVLLANDPLTPDVQIALERSDVSAYYQNLVLAQQNGGLSNKSMLEAELSGYRLALEGPRYDAIRLYLERDTVGNPLDSVWHVVGAPDLPGNANSRVAILLAQKDWAAADAMLQDPEPELTADEVTVWEAVRDVAQNPGDAAQTVAAQSGTLETIAAGNGRAAMMARSLLGQYLGSMFEEPIILPGNRSPRRLNGQEGSSADGMLDAFPNPASDLLRITALSGTPEAAGRLVIYDAQGRVVVERPLQPGLQLFELSVQDWSQGTYRVVLWDAQGKAKSTTVAISR